jgi:putative endonuclease
MHIRSQLGKKAEEYITLQLQKKGFKILERNFRSSHGEIDIIALRDDDLLFIEVKMRQEEYFDLSDVITISKQAKIIHTAKLYIAGHGYEEKNCRFDVALLEGSPLKCTYIPNAFNESDCTW